MHIRFQYTHHARPSCSLVLHLCQIQMYIVQLLPIGWICQDFLPTSQARVFTYARRCDKDPGSGWSRDSFKNLLLGGVGKVSNYMLPHTSDTFQMQGARCSGCEK